MLRKCYEEVTISMYHNNNSFKTNVQERSKEHLENDIADYYRTDRRI